MENSEGGAKEVNIKVSTDFTFNLWLEKWHLEPRLLIQSEQFKSNFKLEWLIVSFGMTLYYHKRLTRFKTGSSLRLLNGDFHDLSWAFVIFRDFWGLILNWATLKPQVTKRKSRFEAFEPSGLQNSDPD